jgi:hypothetical protein
VLQLSNIMHRLAQVRPIFHSEADFQHALAWQIHAEHPDAQIRLEYRPFVDERVYIDIWCEVDGQSTAIELKYPTKRLSATSVEDERFVLAEHSAQDLTRYDIIKDVVRIERVIGTVSKTLAAAIVLTNDPSFWNPSARAVPTIDDAFRIHEGRTLAGSCAWAETAGPGTTKGRTTRLNVRGTYLFAWQDYSSVNERWGLNERWGQFRFVIVEPNSVPHIPL